MPKEMRNTMIYMVSDYIFDMISSMLNNRYAELAKDPSTPFAVGMADYSNYLLPTRRTLSRSQALPRAMI